MDIESVKRQLNEKGLGWCVPGHHIHPISDLRIFYIYWADAPEVAAGGMALSPHHWKQMLYTACSRCIDLEHRRTVGQKGRYFGRFFHSWEARRSEDGNFEFRVGEEWFSLNGITLHNAPEQYHLGYKRINSQFEKHGIDVG